MPDYNTLEQSLDSGIPVLLILFANEDGLQRRYTNSEEEIELEGEVFMPTPMKFGTFKSGEEIAQAKLSIQFPLNHPIAQDLMSPYFKKAQQVTVWRLHTEGQDDEAYVYWVGRVVGVKTSDSEGASVEVENLFTTMQMIGLRAKYQRFCRHSLYSTGCGVNYLSRRQLVTVASQPSPTSMIIPQAAAQPNGYYKGGIVEADGELGFVIGHVGDTLRLLLPMRPAPTTTYLAPGCDLSLKMCAERFGNSLRHGGFPFIPDKSPYGGQNIYVIGS